MYTITIPQAHVKAALPFIPKHDIRHFLNGLHVTPGRIEATNGHCALLIQSEYKGPSIIIPRNICEQAAKTKFPRGYKNPDFTLTVDQDGKSATLQGPDNTWQFTPIDGKFPDVPRVVTQQQSGEAATYNPEYLSIIWNAGALLGRKYPEMRQDGEKGPAVIPLAASAVAVVMPMRGMVATQADVCHDTAWLRALATATAKAA